MEERFACFTLDLEPDFQSRDRHEVLLDDARFGEVEAFFLGNELELTVFVVGRMLEEGLPIRERFTNIQPDFELHSYSHNAESPDSEREIVRGKRAFSAYFGRRPRGYRAPNGAISTGGIAVLRREGFAYDASVFPTWRPELGYNFRKLPIEPWVYDEFQGMLELPFAVVPTIRMVVSLSYLKLLGIGFYRTALRLFGFPAVLVFDSHLYDYLLTTSVTELPRTDWRRCALMRNGTGAITLLQQFVDLLRAHGYTFLTMGELYDRMAARRSELPVVSASALSAA